MPFLGKSPQAGNYILLDSITTSATATYNLTRNSVAYFPASARNLIVSLNGITQAPDTAYSVSGSTITFSSALTSSDVIDYILVLGDVLSIGTPADNTVGIDQLNVSEGTSGQALTTDGSGTLSFSTITASLTGITDNATSTAITIDSSENVGIGTSSPLGQLHVEHGTSDPAGTSTTTAQDLLILENTTDAMMGLRTIGSNGGNGVVSGLAIYAKLFTGTDTWNERLRITEFGNVGIGTDNPQANLHVKSSASNTKIGVWNTGAPNSSRYAQILLTQGSTFFGANDKSWQLVSTGQSDGTTRLQIQSWNGSAYNNNINFDENGWTQIANPLYFGTNLGDVISLYDDRLGDANMYGFGVESSALFSRSLSLFNWYVNQTNDGSSWAMQLNGNGRLTLKGSQSASNAAQVYFIDDASPGLVGGIEFTGSLGNGGNYNSSLQTSGELQYSAAGHFFADTSVVSYGIPGAWHRMNGDFRWGTYSGSTIITEAILMASGTGNLDIDGTLYQNSASTNSDQKMKENVVTLTNCLTKVSQLRGVEFDWKSEYRRDAGHDIGVIAQEVEAVIPEIVTERELQVGIKGNEGETIKSVDYSKFTAVLIEAVKELKTQNEALETRIAALESN